MGRRKDAKLEHVVISERWDKKASKFTTPELPFPFKDKDAYERSIRQPLGKDFNTDDAFRCVGPVEAIVSLCPQEYDTPDGAQDARRDDSACTV